MSPRHEPERLELVEPTDRQMSRVPVRDPELYNELHRRASALALAHTAVFGDRSIGAAEVTRAASAFARELAAPTATRRKTAARHIVTALIPAAELEIPRTWGTTLGRSLVGLGVYPSPRMSRTVAALVLGGVSKQRISQMVGERLLAEDGAGVYTESVARLLALE